MLYLATVQEKMLKSMEHRDSMVNLYPGRGHHDGNTASSVHTKCAQSRLQNRERRFNTLPKLFLIQARAKYGSESTPAEFAPATDWLDTGRWE